MKTVNATEMKNRLGEVLSQARKEPVMVTSYGRPTHVVMDYEDYLALRGPGRKRLFSEIHDPEERVRAFREMIDEMTARTSPTVGPLEPEDVCRERAYE